MSTLNKRQKDNKVIEDEVLGNGQAQAEPAPGELASELPLPKGVTKIKPVDDEYNLEVIVDYYGQIDITYIEKKDPRYAYRWLRDDHKNLSLSTGNVLLQNGGWKLVEKPHAERIGITDKFVSPDGLVRRGDLVLAFMPKELYQIKMDHEKEKAQAPMKAVVKRVTEGDPGLGGGIHASMPGIQTGKQLGLKSADSGIRYESI